MNMKKFMFFLLLPLLAIAVFIVYIYVSASFGKDKTYYFSQIKTYVEIYRPPFSEYGYAIFSKDSTFSFSENIDFVKIYMSETSLVSFIFNPLDNNKIFIVDRSNNAQINQVNLVMKKINREDTTFFEQTVIGGANTHIIKPKYFEFFIEGYLESVFYIDYNIGESPIKAEPIK